MSRRNLSKSRSRSATCQAMSLCMFIFTACSMMSLRLLSFTSPLSSDWYSRIRSLIFTKSSDRPAGANAGVWWLTITPRPRRLTWMASAMLSTMYGYTMGVLPTRMFGSSYAHRPRSLPGVHSCVPWVPKCTMALAWNGSRAHR
ncbi:hypothetical protein Y695_02705 [Hydrogenophaga sp. T4]|nr:hypothetical protein Y695_02705 [Hydrogenophaga sp. T4]